MVVTIGIEIETTNLPLRVWESVGKPQGWTAITDGSIRTNQIKSLGVKNAVIKGEQQRFGAEMVSPIISCNSNMWAYIEPIFELLSASGEVPRANTSIHIHVALPNIMLIAERWDWLKEVDKLLYDVSAPQGVPRGILNNFIYYRPLCSPQWAMTERGTFSPSIGRVENARTEEDMRFVFGRYDRNPPKWYPSRYCGINPVSYFSHGTLEFRHFNFTSDYRLVKAWIYLCIGIVESLKNKNTKIDLGFLMYLGEKVCGSKHIGIDLPVNKVFDTIDLSPVKTHTERSINWNESTYISYPSLLVPEEKMKVVAEVRNAHPSNPLNESPKTIIYLGGLYV